MLHDQTVKDRERIEYRNRLLRQKRDELNMKKQTKKAETEEKEKKLEKFFDTVKPKIDADPIRAISFTEVRKQIFITTVSYTHLTLPTICSV